MIRIIHIQKRQIPAIRCEFIKNILLTKNIHLLKENLQHSCQCLNLSDNTIILWKFLSHWITETADLILKKSFIISSFIIGVKQFKGLQL